MFKIKKSFYKMVLAASAVLLLLVACTQSKVPPQETTVTVQLKWVHLPQFAGFYMAQEKGYYANDNIKVTFLEAGPGINTALNVTSGKADFGVLSPEDILMKRSQGESLTSLATIYRRSAVVFVAMANSGIVRPSDFIGKTLAIKYEQKDFDLRFYAMMKKLGLDIKKLKIVNFDPDYVAFYKGEVDVTAAYATAGLIKIRQKGLKPNPIWPSDYGIHFYSDTLATTDRLIAENPGLVSRFLRASLKGWQDAIEDYRQAVNVTMKYSQIKDQQLQTAMMEAMLPLVHTGEDQIGWMKPEIWKGMYQILLEQKLLARPFEVGQAYTLRFLNEIYGEKAK